MTQLRKKQKCKKKEKKWKGKGKKGDKDDEKNKNKWRWKSTPPWWGQKHNKGFDRKTYYWCIKHNKWTIHKPEECCLEGKVKLEPKQEKTEKPEKSEKKKLKCITLQTIMSLSSDKEEFKENWLLVRVASCYGCSGDHCICSYLLYSLSSSYPASWDWFSFPSICSPSSLILKAQLYPPRCVAKTKLSGRELKPFAICSKASRNKFTVTSVH